MDKPIRIAQIMGKLLGGGVEMVVFNYYRAIDKSKIQFDFYYDADSSVEPPQDLVDMGARFIKIPQYQYLPQFLHALKKHFRANNYTIVHSHINTISVFPLYMAWRCGVPVRIAHNHSAPSGESYKRTALKYFLRSFSRMFPTDYFACSEKAGRWLFGDKNFNEGRVTVIKNAVDFERFRPSEEVLAPLRKELGLENKFVIGCIGRLTFAKNHRLLIEVFKDVKRKRQNAVLLLVGSGELDDELHRIVEAMELTDSVVFAGHVYNPGSYYRLCDVIAVPSIFEGLSLTTIEAQVAGVPVIISNAVPDEAIISDGCTRLDLDEEMWVKKLETIGSESITLNGQSSEYDISIAAKKLASYYIDKTQKIVRGGELHELIFSFECKTSLKECQMWSPNCEVAA